ncbi:hypothetical protein [Culturomica massiliensis]|jgi:hypothetical protein|uniref:hypothetical protein n=1 Tax=Culturomica massiliensis TaxID=1841857 RepID=UPI000E5592E4|nr:MULTISPECIES: hypothetical protein [Odoribacteraceae]
MKQIILSLGILTCCSGVFGQMIHGSTLITERSYHNEPLQTGLRGFAELSPMYSFENDAFLMEISGTYGFQFNSWFYAGVGLSVIRWDNSYGLPLFADIRIYAGQRKIKPYFNLRAGYVASLNSEYYDPGYTRRIKGFYFSPSAGLEIGRFNLSLGTQKLNEATQRDSYGESYTRDYPFWTLFLGFGYNF